jgi:arylsulfatase A-like enzyme
MKTNQVQIPARFLLGAVASCPIASAERYEKLHAAIADPEERTYRANALAGGTVERPVPLYWRYNDKVAWREGDWKIVVDAKLEKPELYDLASDLAEATDLAQRESERLTAMMTRLRAYTAEIAAEAPAWPAAEKRQGREGKRATAPAN